MDLNTLISGLDLRVVGGASGVRVCDITEDSRTAVPGSLFIARVGLKFDGRKSAADAAACGAVAVLADTDRFDPPLPKHDRPVVLVTDRVPEMAARLAERFYGDPTSKLRLVGVTGTNGKTSVATMTRAILQACDTRTGLIGTVEVDDGREVARAAMTTPPAVELSRTFATMVDAGCKAACIEVSSHALDQRRADALRFAVGIFTNLTGDHLDYHKTVGAYLAAKRRLFELLPPHGVRVLNADDPASDAMDGPNARWCSGKGDPRAAWRVVAESADLSGMVLSIESPIGAMRGRAPVVGAHNAMNVLQSAAAADVVLERLGFDAGRRRSGIEAALGAVHPPRGRLQRVSCDDDAVSVFVDYAHTDDALQRTLAAVREVLPAGSTLTVVFGCGGNRDTGKRPRMGKVAVELADRVVITSDNPRSERPAAIVDEILKGITGPIRAKATVQVERGRAIRHAITTARDGEVVVIAGKGHETEQISCDAAGNTVTRHFDDAEEARAVLRERRMRLGPVPGGGAVQA